MVDQHVDPADRLADLVGVDDGDGWISMDELFWKAAERIEELERDAGNVEITKQLNRDLHKQNAELRARLGAVRSLKPVPVPLAPANELAVWKSELDAALKGDSDD